MALASYVSASLTVDGSSTGTLTVADTSLFRPGCTVYLASNNQSTVTLKVYDLPSSTTIRVQDPSKVQYTFFNCSAYTTAQSAKITQPEQTYFGTSTLLLGSSTSNLDITSDGTYIIVDNKLKVNGTADFAGSISIPAGQRFVMNGAGGTKGPFHNNVNMVFENNTFPIVAIGDTASFASPMLTIPVNTTAVGNLGASGPDDLMSVTIQANALIAAGRGLRIKCLGTTANNANAKAIQLLWGGQTLITKQLAASVAGTWEIEATIFRTGASTQVCFAKAINYSGTTLATADGPTVVFQSTFTAGTQTETANIIAKVQSTTSTSDNDIVQRVMIPDWNNS